MVEIKNDDLKQITGGKKAGIWTTIGIVASVIGTLIAGIIDGYYRPLGCNK